MQVRDDANQQGQTVLSSDEPMVVADAFLSHWGRDGDEQILRKYRGDWYRWNGTAYTVIEPEEIRQKMYNFLQPLKVKRRQGRFGRTITQSFGPRRNTINEVIDALQAPCYTNHIESLPVWLDVHRPPPDRIIAFGNGLLNIDEYLDKGAGALLYPPTPKWFSTQVLPYAFTTEARCSRWLKFLNEALEDPETGEPDADRIALLQEWFGYCLTSDTSQQKMLMMVGPRRSGKGTIIRALQQVVGVANCASPSLSDLAEEFGLWGLLNKSVAIIPDAHLGGNNDRTARVIDRLLSITGEDRVDIHRKNQPPLLAQKLNCRFTVAVNRLPNFPDASNAMASRILMLPFQVSFYGREDLELSRKLLPETPGIMLWALEGLRRLREQGRFTRAGESAREYIEEFERRNSPFGAFVESRCRLGPDESVGVDELFEAWKKWATDDGAQAGRKSSFGSLLFAAVPGLRKKRAGSERRPTYVGIGLLPAGMTSDDYEYPPNLDFGPLKRDTG